MSPLATLFVAVIALYLIECVIVVPDEALVLVARRDERWTLAEWSFALGALRCRLVLLPPLAPHAMVLVLPPWTTTLAPTGLVWRGEGEADLTIPYGELRGVAADAGSLRWRHGAIAVHSTRRAQWLARSLGTVAAAPVPSRAAIIEAALDDLTDVGRIGQSVAALSRATRWVRALGVLLFAHLFIVWPLLIVWLGIATLWPIILLELALLVALTCIAHRRARRSLGGEAEGAGGLSTFVLAVSPPAAARAGAVLGRDLLGDVHPLAAALHLCREPEAVALAARARREARFDHPAGPESSFANWATRAVERSIARTIGLHAVPDAPPRDGASASYCPRCWTQYAFGPGECAECGGIALVAFAEGP